jgi:hypothetical protein
MGIRRAEKQPQTVIPQLTPMPVIMSASEASSEYQRLYVPLNICVANMGNANPQRLRSRVFPAMAEAANIK